MLITFINIIFIKNKRGTLFIWNVFVIKNRIYRKI